MHKILNYYRLTGKEKRIGGWDLIWDDGAIVADDTMDCAPTNGSSVSTPNSYLGLLLRGYYMAIIISHPISTRDTHISQRANGPRADIGVSG